MRKIDRHLREFDNHSRYAKYVGKYYEKNSINKGDEIGQSRFVGFTNSATHYGSINTDIEAFCEDYVQYNNMFSTENQENIFTNERYTSIYIKKNGVMLYEKLLIHMQIPFVDGIYNDNGFTFYIVDEDNVHSVRGYMYLSEILPDGDQSSTIRNFEIDVEDIIDEAIRQTDWTYDTAKSKNLRLIILANSVNVYSKPLADYMQYGPCICTFNNDSYNFNYDDFVCTNGSYVEESIQSLFDYFDNKSINDPLFPGSSPIGIYNNVDGTIGNIITVTSENFINIIPTIAIYINSEFVEYVEDCTTGDIYDPESDVINMSTIQLHADKIVDYVTDKYSDQIIETISVIVNVYNETDLKACCVKKCIAYENGEHKYTIEHGANLGEMFIKSIEVEPGKEITYKVYQFYQEYEDNGYVLIIMNAEGEPIYDANGSIWGIMDSIEDSDVIESIELVSQANCIDTIEVKLYDNIPTEYEGATIVFGSVIIFDRLWNSYYSLPIKYYDGTTLELIKYDNAFAIDGNFVGLRQFDIDGAGGTLSNAIDIYKNGTLQFKQIILETDDYDDSFTSNNIIGVSIMMQDDYYGMCRLISTESPDASFIEFLPENKAAIKFNESFEQWYDSIYPGSTVSKDNVKAIFHIILSNINNADYYGTSDDLCLANTTISKLISIEIVPTDNVYPLISYCKSEEHAHYNKQSPLKMKYSTYDRAALRSYSEASFAQYMLKDEDKGSYRYFVFNSLMDRIPDNMFNGVENLTNIEIPDHIKYIGESAFRDCTSLVNITIPANVISIDNNAFRDCYDLEYVIIESTTPPEIEYYVFDTGNNCPIYVPAGCAETYRNANIWSDYADRIQER